MRDRPAFDLFLISWVILFLELACIRWFPAHVLFLTFFTNTVLLACFVGMSIGCLIAKKPGRELRRTPLLLAAALACGLVTELYATKLERVLDVGGQDRPEVVYFGTETHSQQAGGVGLPIEVFAGAFYLLIAAVMVGPGQELGRAFDRLPDRTRAYGLNLAGSLAGIVAFAVCSYFQTPPVVWFALLAGGLWYMLSRPDPAEDAAPPALSPRTAGGFLAVAVLLTVFTSGLLPRDGLKTVWSPYYRIDYHTKYRLIETNHISHQIMDPQDRTAFVTYPLPHLLRRDLPAGDPQGGGWPAFRRVLIIGAGSGNDVARAAAFCPPDAVIDAVEIDPVIQSIGAADHPDRPYQDPRVRYHNNDGRNFLRKAADAEYDLVVFALVDSLVLHSGFSGGVRLESFLFTRDSFRDVRRVLKPTGVAAVYNYFRQGWIVARLREELRAEFGADPLVLPFPPVNEVKLSTMGAGGFAILLAGSEDTLAPARRAFAASYKGSYWVPHSRKPTPDLETTPAGFWKAPPAGFAPVAPERLPPDMRETVHDANVVGVRPAAVEDSGGSLRPATDDWPFVYVRQATLPWLTVRGVALVVALSAGLWFLFRPKPTAGTAPAGFGPDTGLVVRSFLLGAGFMLVETKAVVHMALLFGSTWMVNTVVFAAILLMSLAGTVWAAKLRPARLEPYYVGLFVALVLNLAVPLNAFLGLDRTLQVVGSCALAFAPVAFAGVIFTVSFARSQNPAAVFGANVAGALAGGLVENTSMLLGFQYLLCVAVGFYLLSGAFGNRSLPANRAEPKV